MLISTKYTQHLSKGFTSFDGPFCAKYPPLKTCPFLITESLHSPLPNPTPKICQSNEPPQLTPQKTIHGEQPT